jgi:hypothetical protein
MSFTADTFLVSVGTSDSMTNGTEDNVIKNEGTAEDAYCNKRPETKMSCAIVEDGCFTFLAH